MTEREKLGAVLVMLGGWVEDWALPKQDAEEQKSRSLTPAVRRAEESNYLIKRKWRKVKANLFVFSFWLRRSFQMKEKKDMKHS